MKKEYTLIELAKHYKCSKNAIINWVNAGQLRALEGEFGSRVTLRFADKEVARFFKRHIKGNKRINRCLNRERRRKPIIKKGYRYLWDDKHPKADSDGYVAEHVVVMEKRLKRRLKPDECVHHIDRDRANNDPSNLVVYASQGEHMRESHVFAMKVALKVYGNPELMQRVMEIIGD